MKNTVLDQPVIAPPDAWLAARRELLREEKELTRQRDRLAARRRALPWVKVEKNYTFESPHGRVTLADLFAGCSQLVVYHFMFGPGWEEGCKSCSYVSDHLAPAVVHLRAKDVAFAAISHAPLAELTPFHQRMGWDFPWVSSHGGEFNFDYRVSFTPAEMAGGKVNYNFGLMEFPCEEAPGLSVFVRGADGSVYHTYSTYSRGLDSLIGTYTVLDLVPKGRNEDPDAPMNWVRYHDRYEQTADVDATR
jgi:predicted dithiol-disulfide oxidoreductase (DUF899 family)